MKSPCRNVHWSHGGWYMVVMKDRKRQWINLHTTDEREAVTKSFELRKNPLVGNSDTWGVKVQDFLSWKKANGEWSRDSLDSKGWMLEDFAGFVDGRCLRSVDVKSVGDWRDGLVKRGLKQTTINGYLMAVRSFFRWAVEVKRYQASNPMAGIKVRVVDGAVRKGFVAKAAANDLIAGCEDADLKFILLCGFHAGMRKQEIVEARAGWFSFGVVPAVNIQKTENFSPKDKESRSIPLTGKFAGFLGEYLRDRKPTDYALRPETGKGSWRYRYDFRKPFDEFMAARGHDWVSPHVMRHSFASNLASENVSIYAIAVYMGIDVRVAQKHYAHLRPDSAQVACLD